MHITRRRLQATLTGIALAATALCANAEIARPSFTDNYDRTLDEISMVMSHNAFNYSGVLPNQSLSIQQQLDRGVRAFMLDIYVHDGELHVCHASCNPIISRVAPLSGDLGVIHAFLKANPAEIAVLHIESSIEAADLKKFRDKHPHLFQLAFDPTHTFWKGHENWPSQTEMIAAGQRLLLIAQDKKISGRIKDSPVFVMFDKHILVQNTFNIGSTIAVHDWSCETRWKDIPLDKETGSKGWKRLFLMNHFHKVPALVHGDHDNHWEFVEAREEKHCGRRANFIALDAVDRGDALEYVEHRNNGGVTAYEGNRATQNVVCGFSAGVKRDWSMKDGERLGCENDEMRSLRLRGMKKGQRITFYDRADGTRDDDFGVLNIDRDIPWNSPLVLNDFNTLQYNSSFRYLYSGGDGLAGKVSAIRVEPNPLPHSEAAAVLMRGNSGTQRVSCTIGLTQSGFWNLKDESNCHNDDARSINLMAPKKGTVITVYDSPSGSKSDDYMVIRIKKDLDKVWNVSSFEGTVGVDELDVTYHRVNGLDGKVSSVRVEVP